MLSLISLLSFLLPTQLGFHFDYFNSTVYGFSIDYLIPTLYSTDIIALLIILFGLFKIKYKFKKKYLVYCILYIGFAATNILHATSIAGQALLIYYIPALYRWFKVTEMLLLGIIIINTKKFDIFKNFIKPLSYSIFIVCLLGIMQFINKGSIGGIFYALGERAYLVGAPNIAPYPYSTFSHPNSFAGFLLVFGIFLLQYRSKFKPNFFWLLAILVVVNLILTNSLNVYFTVSLLVLLKLLKSNLTNLAFIDISQRFITHRVDLIKASLQMIKENFWFGVGLNNFIPNLVKVSNTFVNAWELQPVHNIFLLVFSEMGVVGFIVFCVLVFAYLSPVNYSLLAILATGQMDHYWLTLQQNMLLFTYVLVFSKIWKNKK